MKDHTDVIIDSVCCLILIAVMLIPVFAQNTADVHAKAGNTFHRVSAAYHKGADIARP